MSELLEEIKSNLIGEYRWSTDECHDNNTETMNDFIENHMPESVDFYLIDDSYEEANIDGLNHSFNASGDGDSFNHLITWQVV